MPNTSDAGNGASNGSVTRLNPRQIGIMQFQLPNGQRIAIEDATDEQFEVFRLSIGLRVKEPRPDMWTLFDNRCKAIRHALKYGLVQSGNDPQANEKRSEIVPEKEQKTLAEPTEKRPQSIGDESDSGTKTIPGSHAQSAPVAEVVIPGAPLISEMITAVKIAAQHHDFSEVPEGITFSISTEGMSEEQVTEALAKYRDDLFAGICPECGVKIARERQVGRAVYAQCNHRLFQGRART